MPVSHLTAFTAEVLKLYPTFSCSVSISYFDTQQNPKGKWNNNPAACKLMKPFWENQSRRKLDMIDCSWLYARPTKQCLKTCWIFFPLKKSPSRACSSFSDCSFKIWWSRSLHVFKRHYYSSPSPLKTCRCWWADNSKWHYTFCEFFKLPDNKKRWIVERKVGERKEGEDFTWPWRRWLREVVLWRGRDPQSRYIPLPFIAGKGEIFGLSSGNPCWLRDASLLGWLCWLPVCPLASVLQFWDYGSQGKSLEATVWGQLHWTPVLTGKNLTWDLAWHCSGQSRFLIQGDSSDSRDFP